MSDHDKAPPEQPKASTDPRAPKREAPDKGDVAELTDAELEDQQGEQLPDREAMSLVDANIAIPINAAVAANVLSDDAIAYADAEQDSYIDQSD